MSFSMPDFVGQVALDSKAATPISVALVEDNPGLRESLAVLLGGTPGFRCSGSFNSAEAALEGLPKLAPDVVLMDIHLPRLSGCDCVKILRDRLPETKILMLTVFSEGQYIFQALMAGAHGYLSKKTPPAELLKAITEVYHGGAPMSADIAVRVVEYFNQRGAQAEPSVRLSPREQEILEHLAKGALYKEIAAQLGISFDTVQWHIRNIYDKLHVRSRSEAVAKYLRSDPLR
jgi:DNA-binding NarL/FixJ family response regulator